MVALPTRGQLDWDDEIANAFGELDASVQSATANANAALSDAAYAKNRADEVHTSVLGGADVATAGFVNDEASATHGALSATYVPYGKSGQNPLTGFIHADAYGAVGDGTAHPLSESYASLAEAQAAYPDAGVTALTESIDRVAIQQAIAAAATDGLTVQLREGTFIIDAPLTLKAGVSLSGSVLTGYFPAISFTDTQTVGTTLKLAANSLCNMLEGDPLAPNAPYTQTPQHLWQRSSILNVRFDGNRKENYGPAAYDTANIRFDICWNVYLENVYSYSAGGTGMWFEDVNCVYGKSVIAYSCNRHNIYFHDSADSEFTASQVGGARGSALVLDNCIGVNITGGIIFNAEAGAGVLVSAITDVQTTGIEINGTATSQTLTLEVDRTPQYWLLVGTEIISYTGFTGTTAASRTLTGVTRGVNGTTPAAHSLGDRVQDYGDNLFAGVAIINGTTACNVNGVRTDQTAGPGIYIDATSEGNAVHVTQYFAGWGAAADVYGIWIEGKNNTLLGASHKRTPADKAHQSVGVYLSGNAVDNVIACAVDNDFTTAVSYGGDYARNRNTVLAGRRDRGANSTEGQPLISSRYISTGAATTTATLTADTEYAVPIVIGSSGTINLLGVEVTVAGDGASKLRLGIREDLGTGHYPGALVADFGQVASTTTGVKTVGGTAAVKPGLYWLTVTAQSATSVQPTIRISSTKRARVLSSSASAALAGLNAYTQSGVTGTLGSFSGSVTTTATDPLIIARAA